MIYLLNLLAVIVYYQLLGVIYGNTQKRKQVFAVIICIHAVLFRALADPFNYVDTGGYAEAFRNFAKWSFHDLVIDTNFYSDWGRGYLLWNWLLSKISTDQSTLFIGSAVLGVTPVVWFYYKTAPKMLFPILIYLAYPMMYYQGFGVLRQHLSVAFILLAVYYIDNWKKSVPLALIAAFMHTSGIVIYPFFLWKKINLNSRISLKLGCYIVVGLTAIRLLMGYILSFMPKYEEIVQETTLSNRLPLIWFSCIAIASLYCRTYKNLTSRIEEIVMLFFYYGLLVSIFCVGLAGMGRFTMCFLYITPVASAIIIHYSKRHLMNIMVILANVIATIIHLSYSVSNHNYEYTFFWE
jgi:hypothetical protein